MTDRTDRAYNKLWPLVPKLIRTDTPLHTSWQRVIETAKPALGTRWTKDAKEVDLARSASQVSAHFAHVLATERPTARIKGFYFGLFEPIFGRRSIWTLYICGSTRFSRTDRDWAVGPNWWPDGRYAPCAGLEYLSDIRRHNPDEGLTVELCLICPLATLLVGRVVRDLAPSLLLGKAKSRGIGTGFDDGDRYELGTVTPKGFKPFPGLKP